VALFGACMINAVFIGCSTRSVANSTGTGAVVCYSGTYDGTSTLACSFSYKGLTSDVAQAHFHVGGDTASGPVVFNFFSPGQGVVDLYSYGGYYYGTFTAAATTGVNSWVQQGSTTFDAQITTCASGTDCYFNLHTVNYPGGELRCELAPLTATNDFTVPLLAGPDSVNAANSTGTAVVKMATIGTSNLHAWGYQVNFAVNSPVTAAHIHKNANSVEGNTGPVEVYFAPGAQRTSGAFVGVALEGVVWTNITSRWPTKSSDFDSAISNHFCYVNVHTIASPAGEIRANISPSGASQTQVLALFVVISMIASWMSL